MTTRDPSAAYEFGSFRLEAGERVLLRDGTPVPLAPKALQTLLILVERAGHVVPKDELIAAVWPDTFVQESNLTQYVFLLRRALGGDDESFIQTVPRRGYRFACPVITRSSAPAVEEVIVATRTRMHVIAEETTTEQQPIAGPKMRRATMIIAAAALFAAGGFTLSRMMAPDTSTRSAPARLPALIPVTSDSKAFEPAISPDGKLVAYTVLEGPQESIWLRDVARNSAVQIAPLSSQRYRALNFSPDGSELFYKSYRPGVKNGIIFRIPILGGTPQEVARDVWSDFGFSRDGSEVVFIRHVEEHKRQHVIAARCDGKGERLLGRNTKDVNWFTVWDSSPAWSPDGKRIAFCGWLTNPDQHRPALLEMTLADGTVRELGSHRWAGLHQVAWLPDGSALLVVAPVTDTGPSQIWSVDARTNTTTRVTNDLNDYNKLKVSADSRQIVVDHHLSFRHIWVFPEGDPSRARQLTFGVKDTDGHWGLAWTPQDRIVFVSDRTGENEIWSMKPDGSDVRQLTVGPGASNVTPRATRDGRYVLYVSDRGGKSQIWRMDADGNNPVRLTDEAEGANLPDASPDGRWVYFTAYADSVSQLARIPMTGGKRELLPARGALAAPIVSPDGTMVAHDYYDDASGWRNGIVPATGGESKLFDWHSVRGMVRWTPDSRGLVYNDGLGNLWLQPVPGGSPRQLTRFTDGRIWNFAIAPNGRDYALVRGDTLSDVVVIRDFRR